MQRLYSIAIPAAMCLFAPALHAQIVDVSAGTSTAYNSSGANLHLRSRNLEASFGAGVIDGRMAMGGALVRSTRNGSLTLGQQDLATDLPTDIFDNRHTLLGTGIGIRRHTSDSSLLLFSGFTSRGSGSPLFNASSLEQTTHFLQWTGRLTHTCKTTLTAAAGHAALGIASFDCRSGHSFWASSIGGTYGGMYAAGSYAYESRRISLKSTFVIAGPHFQRNFSARLPVPEPVRENAALVFRPDNHWSMQASHGNYITQPIEDAKAPADGINPYRSSMDSAGVQYQRFNFMASATVLHSTYGTSGLINTIDQLVGSTSAASATLRYTLGRANLSEMLMASRGSNGVRTAIAVTTADVGLNSHVRLSESLNLTRDGISVSHGGSLLTRYSTFEAGYQFYYVANQPSQPFQQALLFRADVQMPAVDFRASSSISPTGKPVYTFELARSFSHAQAEREPRVRIGKHVVRGRVEETNGTGVARATLLIDKDRVYTDADGYFFYREDKRRTHYLEVLTTEFVSADRYDVREAPYKVTSSTSASRAVRIVVEKRRPAQ